MNKFPENYNRILLRDCVCSVGHRQKFTEDPEFIELIRTDADYITDYGIKSYLDQEYLSRNDGKAIILNVINGEVDVVDGNRHVCAMLLANPRITVGQIQQVVRFWENGHEYVDEGHVRTVEYTVYIPVGTDTHKLTMHGIVVNEIRDCFKPGYELTKEIPASVPFSDRRFSRNDRGAKFKDWIDKLTV